MYEFLLLEASPMTKVMIVIFYIMKQNDHELNSYDPYI